MATRPVRVPERVHGEVQAAARILGSNPSDLLAEAWNLYTTDAAFQDRFEQARKAFAIGDLAAVTDLIVQQQIAKRLAAAQDPPE